MNLSFTEKEIQALIQRESLLNKKESEYTVERADELLSDSKKCCDKIEVLKNN
ncbi:hypothetical protein [Spiroplasma endosymbiont of Nebria brevicollis]|uniref:hypothetical protein n=1 Tax=Spiroplasma endosymbiont of Nebria brevicollis TaxID=3066284 RepID=UPI00313A962E